MPSVDVKIYNLLGTEIRTLLEAYLTPGTYTYRWDGKDNKGQIVPSGIYLYTLQSGSEKITRKMIFKK